MENLHLPVLAQEVLRTFQTVPASARILDATLGGGGHADLLLDAFSNTRVLGCDWDSESLHATSARLFEKWGNRFAPILGAFNGVVTGRVQIPAGFEPPWDGILCDLGYSSNQLNAPEYGMSFQIEAPLDMRLARPPSGATAWELLNEASARELGEIFKVYGEIPHSFSLARRIKNAIEAGHIENSTVSLAASLPSSVTPQVFQALRIAINDELRNLDEFLAGAIMNLSAGGVLAIISFHSLEDRIVKQFAQYRRLEIEPIFRKPVLPSAFEIETNPRARSAKLRAFKKAGP